MKTLDFAIKSPSIRVWAKNTSLQEYLNKNRISYIVVPKKRNANMFKCSHYSISKNLFRRKIIAILIDKKEVINYTYNNFNFVTPTVLKHKDRDLFAFFLARDIQNFKANYL